MAGHQRLGEGADSVIGHGDFEGWQELDKLIGIRWAQSPAASSADEFEAHEFGQGVGGVELEREAVAAADNLCDGDDGVTGEGRRRFGIQQPKNEEAERAFTFERVFVLAFAVNGVESVRRIVMVQFPAFGGELLGGEVAPAGEGVVGAQVTLIVAPEQALGQEPVEG